MSFIIISKASISEKIKKLGFNLDGCSFQCLTAGYPEQPSYKRLQNVFRDLDSIIDDERSNVFHEQKKSQPIFVVS